MEAGAFETVSVPTEDAAVETSVEAGDWLPYLQGGRRVVDAIVQSKIIDPRISFDHLASTMVQIPEPVPADSTTTFISQYNERIVYNNGARKHWSVDCMYSG